MPVIALFAEMVPEKYYKFVFIFILTLSVSACLMNDPKLIYLEKKAQENYPSGSTISNWDGRFYIMGDDASELLILKYNLEEEERILLFPKGENIRAPKATKADIESSVLISRNGKKSILLFGSGSLTPHRDSAFLFHLHNKEIERLDLTEFYDQLRKSFKQLNIEAATEIGEELIFGIRANTSHPDNFLAVASSALPSLYFKRKILIRLPVAQAGISGMDYDRKNDILFITFSSESTSNAFDDGEIGDSYLAIVQNAKQKLRKREVTIDYLTKLTDLSSDFLHQKIESVSLITEKNELLLVADDDLGNTTLFRLRF